ncbi:helix-turn-helix transcriptional regulator [Streptomyces sp. NA04227]|uniref:ArsR/SmtB family transcription factor n=1 Tax=Streptomyces sp. NA04227 TaxID=2742136 RepID=UPI00159050E5|nr:metalloregulator ArsR/SmtB family transcription factor [Streptomyces sp. NA04227]QKW10522.1 helix-turn-helix transcriptional regulator [Streptomyces sp. NA04227]
MTTREPGPVASGAHERAPGREQLRTAATVFALLADPTRLHLLWLLAQGPADVTALTTASGAARTAVSQHLAKLRLAGLVHARREGRHAVYALSDGHLRRLVVEALSHADHQVTGAPWHA